MVECSNVRSSAGCIDENEHMAVFTIDQVLGFRMKNLLLASRKTRTPAEVVAWMGAMQAQDLASSEWSFGVRCPGLTQADVHQATVDRQILRTWPMRGTVHFVPPADAKWMLDVAGVRAVAGAERRRQQLGLTEPIVTKATKVLHDALQGGRMLTRAECVSLLIDAGVHTAPEHGYHLLWFASQVGVTCIGPQRGKDQTFVLLDEWVPKPNVLDRNEGLKTLAVRYFRSHGPATEKDFVGWTGLTVGDAKRGITLAGKDLVRIDTVSGPMITSQASLDDGAPTAIQNDELLLLPGFDEYILGYKDRTAMLSAEHFNAIVPGGNGVFRPTLVANGRVIGTWKRTIKKQRVEMQPIPFAAFTKRQHQAFANASRMYAEYLQLEPAMVGQQ
jgi:Winged helix DNA-binding domain